MGIRVKILLGFFILASMLFISGAISIFELTKLSRAVKMMINDSYRSIDYSKQMLDAIEKQEKIILFFIGTKSSSYEDSYKGIAKHFELNLDSAKTNLTFKNEKEIIDSISYHYRFFKDVSDQVFRGKLYLTEDYIEHIYPHALATKEFIKQLMVLNQKELYESAAFHEASAQRALMPGLIVILTSLLFTFIFTYLINHYFVSPIIRLTKGINDYVKYNKPFGIPLETRDELWKLKESITNLIAICRTSNRKTE
jgi:CHASE3 domain sensor protein